MEQQDQAKADSCAHIVTGADVIIDINIDIDTALRKILLPRLSQERCKCARAWEAFEASDAHKHFMAFDAFVAAEEEALKAEGGEYHEDEASDEEASGEEASEPMEDSEDTHGNIIIEGFHPNHYRQVIEETGAREIMAESLKALRECPSQPPDTLQFIREHFFSKFDPKMEEYWDIRAASTRMSLEEEAQLQKTRLETLVRMKENLAELTCTSADLKAEAAMLKAQVLAQVLEVLKAQAWRAEGMDLKLE